MGRTVSIANMADEIMKGLMEYKDLATDDMKTAVKNAGKTVKRYSRKCSKENRCIFEKLDCEDHERKL